MSGISHEQISSHVTTQLGDVLTMIPDEYGIFTAEVPLNQLYRVVHFLFKDPALEFNFLTDICGVHYPDDADRELAVVYHIQSMRRNTRMRVKAFIPITKPEVPSLTGIYASANWMERETYDFYGVQFLGHPDLRRILNMDEMVDFPLRKEFPLEDPLREDKKDYHFGR
ncbi:MAG: NADH-quinone oxidoreductase subunit C [Saprospiraceae bacterium]|nr:NADH-quinone oxidoreductase subunit C [Candidatus Vicinibacter affinis]